MHELGIVFYIIRDVKEVAEQHGVEHVSAVVMDIGEVTTIVPEYLRDCWRWAAAQQEPRQGRDPRLHTIPAVTYCDSCHREYGTLEPGKTCPHCGRDTTSLLRGNEVEIKEIEAN